MARPPPAHGILARALYEKYHNDEYINNFDMTQWYKLPNEGQEIHEKYRAKFYNLIEPDSLTLQWLEASKAKSSDLWLQIWHIVAKLFLKLFLTQTSSNGLLRRGSMFILSENVRALHNLFISKPFSKTRIHINKLSIFFYFIIIAICSVPCPWRLKFRK